MLVCVLVLSVGARVGVDVSPLLVVRLSQCSLVLVGFRVFAGDLWCWCGHWQ